MPKKAYMNFGTLSSERTFASWGFQKEEKEAESLFKETIAENSPNIGSNVDIQVH